MSETLIHVVIGEPTDDCPLCRAARDGASGAELLALAADPGLTLPPGVGVAVIDARARGTEGGAR